MTIKELVDRSYKQAISMGWDHLVPVPEMIALIHSEASEALESYRREEPLYWKGLAGKPEGIASEFADILIRIGHYCGTLNIDLEQAIKDKLEYNLTRGFRHGGKKV